MSNTWKHCNATKLYPIFCFDNYTHYSLLDTMYHKLHIETLTYSNIEVLGAKIKF